MSEHQNAATLANYIERIAAQYKYSEQDIKDLENRLKIMRMNMIYRRNRGPIGGNCQENSGDPSG